MIVASPHNIYYKIPHIPYKYTHMCTTLHSRTPHASLGAQTLPHKGPGRSLAGYEECSVQVKESLSAFRSPGARPPTRKPASISSGNPQLEWRVRGGGCGRGHGLATISPDPVTTQAAGCKSPSVSLPLFRNTLTSSCCS